MGAVDSERNADYAAMPAIRPRPWLAAWTLCRREWVRFIRQGNRVFAALGQPIIFWILLSGLLGTSFQMGAGAAGQTSDAIASGAAAPSISYAQYFFPGTLVMIILFTAIFATISVIEDRREGFLQSVLVAPVPRWSVVIGKVLGGALIALAHAAVFMLLCFTLNVPLTHLYRAGRAGAVVCNWHRADVAGAGDCVANAIDARFSCDHDGFLTADVAAVGRICATGK